MWSTFPLYFIYTLPLIRPQSHGSHSWFSSHAIPFYCLCLCMALTMQLIWAIQNNSLRAEEQWGVQTDGSSKGRSVLRHLWKSQRDWLIAVHWPVSEPIRLDPAKKLEMNKSSGWHCKGWCPSLFSTCTTIFSTCPVRYPSTSVFLSFQLSISPSREHSISIHSVIITPKRQCRGYYGFIPTAATIDPSCERDNWKSSYLNLFKFAVIIHGP